MTPMTPRQRFLNCLKQQQADRPSVGNPTSIATVPLMEATGCAFPAAHLDPRQMAGLAAAGFEILGYDTLAPVFSVTQEAAALGCSIDWGRKDQMPTVSGHKCTRPEDIVNPDNFLKHEACATVLEAERILRKKYPDVALIGKVFGPWTLAYHLFGVENFLMMTLDEPAQVHEIIRRLKPLPVLFARAQFEAGCDAITLGDHASGDMVSSAMYHEFLWPAHREIAKEFPLPVIQHTCGNTADRLADIAQSGFAAFHFDSKVPAAKARQLIDAQGLKDGRRKIALVGNINNPSVLLQGTPRDVFNSVEECLRQQIEIIGPECAVPLSTPTENLKAIVEAVKTMCK